jgi:hypothetical protein
MRLFCFPSAVFLAPAVSRGAQHPTSRRGGGCGASRARAGAHAGARAARPRSLATLPPDCSPQTSPKSTTAQPTNENGRSPPTERPDREGKKSAAWHTTQKRASGVSARSSEAARRGRRQLVLGPSFCCSASRGRRIASTPSVFRRRRAQKGGGVGAPLAYRAPRPTPSSPTALRRQRRAGFKKNSFSSPLVCHVRPPPFLNCLCE